MYSNGMSLLEQKRIQWAREREEMIGLCGLWGSHEKETREAPAPTVIRRNSLLPPIQNKVDEIKAEESETSGYISDSPQHDSESHSDGQQWSARRRSENYWADRKAQKNFRNESRLRQTPDSVLSTPEDRMKWGDRGVGVGHLWEPVVELPDSRLPQVFESYRATPRWVERGLKLANGNKADILYIQHDEDQASKFLLGQNVPLPPEILEERERKRQKALEHQNAIIKQLEDRERKRKEEKENRLREERLEEQRLLKEQEIERRRLEEEMRKVKVKEELERLKEEAMREAIKSAEFKAKEEKKKIKKIELDGVNERFDTRKIKEMRKVVKEEVKVKTVKDSFCQAEVEEKIAGIMKDCSIQSEETPRVTTQFESHSETLPKIMTDSCNQSEETPRNVSDSSSQSELIPRFMTDSSSQSENISGLEFINVARDGGLALVLDGVPDAVQLALLMPQGNTADISSKFRGVRMLTNASTQTKGSCCSVYSSSIRSRRSQRQSGRASGRSESSDKSISLERRHTISHSHCCSSKQRSRSQPRLSMGDRPKWGINRPSVQYLKQSEKDPHYMKKLKRRSRKNRGTVETNIREKMLESEFQLLAFQTDEEAEKTDKVSERKVDFADENLRDVLANGFRMVSNPSSPRFVPIKNVEVAEESVEGLKDLNDRRINESSNHIDDENIQKNFLSQSSSMGDFYNPENAGSKTSASNIEEASFETDMFPTSSQYETNISDNSFPFSSEESNSPRTLSGSSNVIDNNLSDVFLASPEDISSPPSSGRSEIKSTADDGDCDESAEEEKPEVSRHHSTSQNESLSLELHEQSVIKSVAGTYEYSEVEKLDISPPLFSNQKELLSQITALRMGLKRMENDAESRCSTPLSVLSLPEEND